MLVELLACTGICRRSEETLKINNSNTSKPIGRWNWEDDEWELLVNDDRVLLWNRRPIGSGQTSSTGVSPHENDDYNNEDNNHCNKKTWTSLSHAVLNGGLRTITDSSCMQVLNARVPEDYNGISPNPLELLKQLANKESNSPPDNDHTARKTTTTTTTTTTMMI